MTRWAAAEETIPAPKLEKKICSLFSTDMPVIPTTMDEMLPVHQRRDTTSAAALPNSSSNHPPSSIVSFGAGQLQGEMRSDMDEARMERLYEKLERGGYLARRDRPPDNLFTRGMEAVFAPEVIKIGGTSIAFSPYTAIKRKNPLCLLNPIPIVVSW
jgi:hypothetical protein